jgi:4-hydroxy-tetrahydrodipicolinate synthase
MSNMTATTTLRLANEFSNIIAVKEASGNLDQIAEIIENKPEGFLVISGDDNLTLPILALGGDGVISVSANAFTLDFSNMVRAGLEGNIQTARALHYKLFTITKLLFEEGNPAGIKESLHLMGLCGKDVRLPLVEATSILSNKLKAELSKQGYL